jgi:3-phosphoshikimate 1-carboxyvinyltransferase
VNATGFQAVRAVIRPGRVVSGHGSVPGDKSIAHRWLLLAATARGGSELVGLPDSLDVRSTARALADLSPESQLDLHAWIHMKHLRSSQQVEGSVDSRVEPAVSIRGDGRAALRQPPTDIDCGNSGTSMRLLAGVVAACAFRSVLTGDDSLRRRPMERVAAPLREMGARVDTTAGRPPLVVRGGPLTGIRYAMPVPSAQVKGAILLAAMTAEGATTVMEPAITRDHTERALEFLGAPVAREPGSITVGPFQHGGFRGVVPGDPSSAAFLAGAAALTGGRLVLDAVGLNPSRTGFLEVLRRMGARVEERITGSEVGEPVGALEVDGPTRLRPAVVGPDQLPAVIDEVPLLALLAAHADGESRFEGAAELRVKESDRLSGLAQGIRELGGAAEVQGDALVVRGGGLAGGATDARGDHRLAMAFSVGSLAARVPCTVAGMEWAEVSFPGFVRTLRGLGADIDAQGGP